MTAVGMSISSMSTIERMIMASIGNHGVTSSATELFLPAPVVDHMV